MLVRIQHRPLRQSDVREDKMVTVTPVRQELEPWLGSVASHVAGQAILNEEALVRFFGLDGNYKREQASTEYHVNLLGFARDLLLWKWLASKEKHGRAPRVRGSTQEKITDTVERGMLKSEAPSNIIASCC